jgi:hypothetical protein
MNQNSGPRVHIGGGCSPWRVAFPIRDVAGKNFRLSLCFTVQYICSEISEFASAAAISRGRFGELTHFLAPTLTVRSPSSTLQFLNRHPHVMAILIVSAVLVFRLSRPFPSHALVAIDQITPSTPAPTYKLRPLTSSREHERLSALVGTS